jgi:ribonuclease HI
MPGVSYDSELEDNPREVLDIQQGDFTLDGADPPFTFKIHEFNPQVELADGSTVPFRGVLTVRPVPSPAAVIRAKQVMGNYENGVWTGTAFVQPSSEQFSVDQSPDAIFRPRFINTTYIPVQRFCIRRRLVPQVSSLKTMAVYTDGACLSNGSTTTTPRGGCALVFKTGNDGTISFPLENEGPDGQVHAHTNSRAELRAVIGALQFRTWWGEGWERIVIMTDSEYVASHATGWMRAWAGRGWRTAAGRPVANRDLWEHLSELMGNYAAGGCEISFWAIPRRWNTLADRAAKAAAERSDMPEKYGEIFGVMV